MKSACLSDGRFLYLDGRSQLRLENASAPGTFELLYGGTVLDFAVQEERGLLALLSPLSLATSEMRVAAGAPRGEEDVALRVYRFSAAGELGDVVDEMNVPRADRVLWGATAKANNSNNNNNNKNKKNAAAPPLQLLTSHPKEGTTIIDFKGEKLKISVKDNDRHPFFASSVLGLVNADGTACHMWSLSKNRMLETLRLSSSQKAKKAAAANSKGDKAEAGKTRTVSHTYSAGCFGFVVNDDASFYAVHAAPPPAEKPRPPTSLLTNFSPASRRPRKGEVIERRADGYWLCAHAVSPTEVLVGMSASAEVVLYEYSADKNALRIARKHRVCAGGAAEDVVALSATRCLVRDVATGDVTVRPLPAPQSQTPAQPQAPGEERKERKADTAADSGNSGNGNGSSTKTDVAAAAAAAAGSAAEDKELKTAKKKNDKKSREASALGVAETQTAAHATGSTGDKAAAPAPDAAAAAGGVPVVAVASVVALAAVAAAAVVFVRSRK